MNKGKFIFAQLTSFISRYEFDKCVLRYQGDYKVQDFSCWNQFLYMMFGQLTHRESSRDIITCLKTHRNKVFHLGIKQIVAYSTLTRANENRSWQIYADFASYLIDIVRPLYTNRPVKTIKHHIMRKITTIFFILFILISCNNLENDNNYYRTLKQAAKHDKIVILDFSAIWCGGCKAYDIYVFNDSIMQGELNKKYIVLKIDRDKQENKFLVNKFKIQGLPHVVLIDKNEEILGSILGFKKLYLNHPEKFLTDIENILALQRDISKLESAFQNDNKNFDTINDLLKLYEKAGRYLETEKLEKQLVVQASIDLLIEVQIQTNDKHEYNRISKLIDKYKNEIQEPIIELHNFNYSFFVAGHTYGNPMNIQYGLYPPFVNSIPYINNYPKMSLGILTGDVVNKPTREYWDSVLLDINKFTIPIHIAAGNHDRGFEFERIFKDYYYHFILEDDLFIILSPTNWNIEGEQKKFLLQTIDNNYQLVQNIFIFCHELIWWSPENQFSNVEINYRPHYPGSTNYWTEINPFLDSIPNNVIIFAGDLGCVESVSAFMYFKEDNITLIGSGMGGGKEDNIVIVEVSDYSVINYKLIGLNNTPFSEIEILEEYVLP